MKTALLLVLLAFTSAAVAMPSRVILIRHGEEPLGNEGTELSKVGWKRAEGLTHLFGNAGITQLIALKPHKKKGSIRSIQTLQPLSSVTGLPIQAPFTRDEVSDLVQTLTHDHRYDGQVVLVAWQHETLADIAHQLGAVKAPGKWGQYFDRYWVLDFTSGKVKFQNLPQRLLSGDSAQ